MAEPGKGGVPVSVTMAGYGNSCPEVLTELETKCKEFFAGASYEIQNVILQPAPEGTEKYLYTYTAVCYAV